MEYLIFGSLLVLALGLFMSITFMALSHILIIVPVFSFFPQIKWKRFSKSNWALLIFSILIPISVIATHNDQIGNKFFHIMKFKYYFLGALMATPFAWFLKTKASANRNGINNYCLVCERLLSANNQTASEGKQHFLGLPQTYEEGKHDFL